MVCDHHWTCEPPQVQQEQCQTAATFALATRKLYLDYRLSHFLVAFLVVQQVFRNFVERPRAGGSTSRTHPRQSAAHPPRHLADLTEVVGSIKKACPLLLL